MGGGAFSHDGERSRCYVLDVSKGTGKDALSAMRRLSRTGALAASAGPSESDTVFAHHPMLANKLDKLDRGNTECVKGGILVSHGFPTCFAGSTSLTREVNPRPLPSHTSIIDDPRTKSLRARVTESLAGPWHGDDDLKFRGSFELLSQSSAELRWSSGEVSHAALKERRGADKTVWIKITILFRGETFAGRCVDDDGTVVKLVWDDGDIWRRSDDDGGISGRMDDDAQLTYETALLSSSS